MENKNQPKVMKVIYSINIVEVVWKKINLEPFLTPCLKEYPYELNSKYRINL